jgi:hypothetical protein
MGISTLFALTAIHKNLELSQKLQSIRRSIKFGALKYEALRMCENEYTPGYLMAQNNLLPSVPLNLPRGGIAP